MKPIKIRQKGEKEDNKAYQSGEFDQSTLYVWNYHNETPLYS
jgi:hypothetical protein